jgi:hypothetical protein
MPLIIAVNVLSVEPLGVKLWGQFVSSSHITQRRKTSISDVSNRKQAQNKSLTHLVV